MTAPTTSAQARTTRPTTPDQPRPPLQPQIVWSGLVGLLRLLLAGEKKTNETGRATNKRNPSSPTRPYQPASFTLLYLYLFGTSVTPQGYKTRGILADVHQDAFHLRLIYEEGLQFADLKSFKEGLETIGET